MRSVVLFALPLALACHRPEEPQSVNSEPASSEPTPPAVASPSPAPAPSAALVTTSVSVPAAPSSTPPAPCVVPLPETPPPVAKPATMCPHDPGPVPKLARGVIHFKEAKGAPRLVIERAVSPAEHERGLMYRTKMPENQGMLFEWPNESRRVFWMHNTCIPLDMLFIAKDGTIAGILEQVPVMNDAPRTVPCNAGYVLEVNAGWCRRHSIKPGTHVTIE